MTPTGGTRYFRFIPNHETGVSVRPSPGYAGEVAEHILELLLLQITEVRILWEDDDGAAVCPAAPWRHRGRGVIEGSDRRQGLLSTCCWLLMDLLAAGWTALTLSVESHCK